MSKGFEQIWPPKYPTLVCIFFWNLGHADIGTAQFLHVLVSPETRHADIGGASVL